MGTIVERKRQDGTSSFTAQIRLRIDGQPHSEAQTFHRRKLAESWLKQREAELAKGLPKEVRPLPFRDLLQRYLHVGEADQADYRERMGKGKYDTLLPMLNDAFAQVDMKSYVAADLIAYVRRRRETISYRHTLIQPSTVLNELSFIKQLLTIAKTEWNHPIDLEPFNEAYQYCMKQRLVTHSRQRERRITQQEEEQLMERFANGVHQLPMQDLMQFALHSSRRVAEICRIRWDDLDVEKKTILVRNVKHPRNKEGNHRRCRLTDEAIAIIQRQPKVNERIFPYRPESVSSALHQACLILGIRDLRFHDLRHEAISRLFEKGYQIHEVALFSLHQSWEHLKRYTHLKAEDIRDI